jgi:hypothetical protein
MPRRATQKPAVRQKPAARPIFISHAVADAEVVNLFVEKLLIAGIGIGHEHIFNVSAKTSPLKVGENFSPEIRKALTGAKLVIAIVTETYLARPFTMAELGAAWALQKLMPILVPPVDFSKLEGVLQGVQCVNIVDGNALHGLYDQFDHKRLNKDGWFERAGSGTFAEALAGFQKGVQAKLKKPDKPTVHRQSRQQSSTLDGVITVKLKMSLAEEQEQFESTLDAVRKALAKLPPVVRLAFMYRARGENASIETFEKEACRAIGNAEHAGFLRTRKTTGVSEALGMAIPMDVLDVILFWPDLASQYARDADQAIEALASFLGSASAEFRRRYEDKHGHAASERIQAFWRAHKLLGENDKTLNRVRSQPAPFAKIE